MRTGSFEDKRRLRIGFAVQLFQERVSAAVTEKHRPLLRWCPPDDLIGSSDKYPFRQYFNGHGWPQTFGQFAQHRWRNQLPIAEPRSVGFMNNVMKADKRVPVWKAVVVTGPVHQQHPAQPEVLTGTDVDGGIHRTAPV